jgi:hypothetical protein
MLAKYGIGAVLLQVAKPVSFQGAKVYPSREQQLLALIYTLTKLRGWRALHAADGPQA